MPIDLSKLFSGSELRRGKSAPVAVLTMELQRGVIGDLATFPELRAAVETRGAGQAAARVCDGARVRNWPVVHCLAEFRPDWSGSVMNTPLHTAMSRIPGHLVSGTASVELIPELQGHPEDLAVARTSGVSPFLGTGLDQLLRNLGVSVLVVTGVSVNLGVLGLCIEAANLGYQVVLATDAVAGLPANYADHVIKETLSLITTLATVDEILSAAPLEN